MEQFDQIDLPAAETIDTGERLDRVEHDIHCLIEDLEWSVRHFTDVIALAMGMEELDTPQSTPKALPERDQNQEGEKEFEKLNLVIVRHIGQVLASVRWNKTRAAKILGVNVKTMYNYIHRYGVDRIRTAGLESLTLQNSVPKPCKEASNEVHQSRASGGKPTVSGRYALHPGSSGGNGTSPGGHDANRSNGNCHFRRRWVGR
jgi:hypothetical protein